MQIVSKISTKARFLMIGYGLMLLFWMSLEDTGTVSVAVLGIGATVIYGGLAIQQKLAGRIFSALSWALGIVGICTLLGALSPITTALLMFFKTSWHGHVYPDYPLPMMTAMLDRVPLWGLAGGFIGLAIVSWTWVSLQTQSA